MNKVNAVIDCLRGANIAIESVQPHRFSLEDILVEVMETKVTAPSVAAPKDGPP